MNKTLFSVIIPVYNGHNVIGRALDSVYSQNLNIEDFEVICVDDCSPTMDTLNALNNYTYNGTHPANLKVYRHDVNKRQGGARNTASAYVEGKWILYLDQDDCFVENSLEKLLKYLEKWYYCDIVMFDHRLLSLDTNVCNIYTNQGIKTEVIPGVDFIQKYPMPWTPWCYAYKKSFLLEHDLRFVENVRFEDVDYVMKSTMYARNMVFLPMDVYCHIDSGENTSFVGNDVRLIEDLFKISIRMKNVSCDFFSTDKDAAMSLMGHHIFHYHDLLVRYLWRLPYTVIVKLLYDYPPYNQSGDVLINCVIRYPRLYACGAQVVRPFLLIASWLRNMLKR